MTEKNKKIAEEIAMKLRGNKTIDPSKYYEVRNLIFKELEDATKT